MNSFNTHHNALGQRILFSPYERTTLTEQIIVFINDTGKVSILIILCYNVISTSSTSMVKLRGENDMSNKKYVTSLLLYQL